ncbi:hypothetical protein Tco_0890566 [Tanacetum coccineum]|uniref:Uncharacterized protein n=1 Tax=Tanacetum coccineum TaxID=301880 RepID=A0ABQ5C298_9ASTR
MAALPRCDELRRAVNSSEWEDMFILYCRRAVSEDVRLAREINALCAGLTAVIKERKNFVDELDVLVDRFVPEKMDVFMKESQGKDTPNLMKLQILGMEFELRAREKNLFIEKLSGGVSVDGCWKRGLFVDFSFVFLASSWFFAGRAVAAWLDGGVPVFKEEDDTVSDFSFPLSACSCSLTGSAVGVAVGSGACNFSASSFHGCPVILSAAGVKKVRGVVAELSRAADSHDIRDHLLVLFLREVVEDSEKMHEHHRFSGELRGCKDEGWIYQ